MQIERYGWPFNSKWVGYSPEGFPEGDRDGNSDDLSGFFSCYIRDGIVTFGKTGKDDDSLKCEIVPGSMRVRVHTGRICIRGRMRRVLEPETVEIPIEAEGHEYKIVMRLSLDNLSRSIKLTYTSEPVRTDTIYDMQLAVLRTHTKAETLDSAELTDTRWDDDVCGISTLLGLSGEGVLTADMIEAISGIVTPYIYSDNGAIVNAVVRRLRTDLSKPFRYLRKDTSDVHYQDIGDTETTSGRYFKVDVCRPELPPVQFSIPNVEGYGETGLWWYNGIEGGSMTTNPDYAVPEGGAEPVPVMVYQYDEVISHQMELRRTPRGWWGVEAQWGNGVDAYGRGAGREFKDETYFQIDMNPGLGEEIAGIRFSVKNGTELYNRERGVWEYPGGGIGDWDDLEINSSGFTVRIGEKSIAFETPRDAQGRIYAVNGHGKNRTVRFT